MAKENMKTFKSVMVALIIVLYLLFGTAVFLAVGSNLIAPLPPRPLDTQRGDSVNDTYDMFIESLRAAQDFTDAKLVREDGHIYSYYDVNTGELSDSSMTSEAASYYLLWNAKEQNKVAFDRELDYIEKNMIHPEGRFMMWKLDDTGQPLEDGANVATDADLRAIRALHMAHGIWDDDRYSRAAEDLTDALENVALTEDRRFSAYGGVRDGEIWKTEEVWLSYADFNAFSTIYWDRGQPWRDVHHKMKISFLDAQDDLGPYSTQLEADRAISSRLDNDGYSINSLWVMVRAAESEDEELRRSAQRALEFYKSRYARDGIIFTDYKKDGTPGSGGDSPWAYSLVGRAAIALGDEEFADSMIYELLKEQVRDPSSELYGAFPEGPEGEKKVGQFTMQEIIITLQDYVAMKTQNGDQSR